MPHHCKKESVTLENVGEILYDGGAPGQSAAHGQSGFGQTQGQGQEQSGGQGQGGSGSQGGGQGQGQHKMHHTMLATGIEKVMAALLKLKKLNARLKASMK